MGAALAVAAAAGPLRAYYTDSALARDDYRGTARYLEAVAGPEDAIILNAAGQQEVFGYYYHGPIHPAPRPSTAPARTVQTLTELASQGERVWYVCRFAREELAPEVDRWFWQNAVRMLRIKGKPKRVGRWEGHSSSWKKAYVRLKQGEKSIEYFEGV